MNFTGKVADEDVMVGATATYGSPNAGNSNPITVIYSLSGADKDNYLKPTDDASTTGEIAKKQLIVTETDLTTSKVYDGTTTAAISSVTFTGKVADEDVSVGATATYASPDAGSGTAILTTYSLRGSKSANYLKPNDSLDAGTIQKMPLTVIWTTVSPSKVYDGTAQATLTSKGLLGGVLPSDKVSFTASAAYDSADAGEGKTVTASYVLDGPHGHNYYVPENTSLIATIAKRQLTVSGTTVTSTKAYDGTTSAKVNIHGNLAEYISEDNVWVQATATYDAKAVGTGKRISLTYTVNGTDKDNYLAPIGSTATETGVITPKQLKATNYTSPPYKEYDGTTASAAPTFTLLDMVSSDDVRLTATATFVSPDVNPRQSISVAYALEGADKDNYIIPEFMPAIDHAEIMAKPLTIGLPSFPAGKTYDGTRAVTGTVTLGSLSGVVSDDVVTVSAVASYDSAAVATNNHITFIYTLSGTDAGNYRKPNNHWLLAPVTKAVLTATVGDYSKVYGEANPTFTVFVTGFVNGESTSTATGYVAPTAYSSATTTTNAGTSIISITGGSATNYSFNINDTGTLTIEKPLGPSMSDTLVGYYPASPSSPSIINLTGFSTNLTNLEASVAIDGSSFGTYAVVEVDSRNRAMILPNEGVAVTSATKVRVRVKESSTLAAGPAMEFGLTSQSLSVGDYYQGGVVAYVFASGDPGFITGQVHGLIAAKSDISTSKIAWSNSTTTIVGTEGGIGRGLINTDKIVTSLGGSAGSYAAGMTRAYRGGGYSDWFLPTRDELWKLRINYNLIGNFATPATSYYWSSTEELVFRVPVYTGDTVYANDMIAGNLFLKTDTHLVRAVRYF
ncbi:MAG: YDG domain-containing protein [Sphaerochaeta sp.]|nr:YDG domain-containing protein [Sphaerochaeta sp.]